MNEKMPFKMGVKFDVPFFMGRIILDILYEVGSKSAKTELLILGRYTKLM